MMQVYKNKIVMNKNCTPRLALSLRTETQSADSKRNMCLLSCHLVTSLLCETNHG